MRPVLSGLPRTYWILWTGALINRLGGFVLPLLALYLTGERGLSVERAGFCVALLGAGSLCAGPLGGWLADRIGRRPTLVLALVLGSASMLQLAYARAPAHIAFAAFLLGLLGDLYRPAVSAAISDLVTGPDDRVRAFGLLYWAVNLGFAVAGTLGGLLAQKGWMLLFWGDAVTTLCYAAVVYARIPETKPLVQNDDERLALAVPLSDRPFVLFVLLTLLVAALFHQSFVTLPVDLRAHGVSPARYGALIALNGVLIVILQPFVATALRRFARHRVLAAAAALVGLGFGLTAFATTQLDYAGCIAVWTLGEITMSGIGPSVVADLAPVHLRGAYQGVFQSSWGGAAMFAPIIGSLVMGAYGARTLWIGCFFAGLCAAAGQLALGSLRRAPNLAASDAL